MIEPMCTDWRGCYDEGWRNGLITQESFAHPAKFSYSLAIRIVRHGLDQGYWRAGDTVGDPFGGVACGGIVCGYHGLNWVGVEIEPRFVEMGGDNIALHAPRWMSIELANRVVLLQGDSRRFAEVVGEHLAGVVTSPPYAEGLGHGGKETRAPNDTRGTLAKMESGYGDTVGQIGALPTGTLDAVVTSPPWEANTEGVMKASKFKDPIAFAEAQHTKGHGCSVEAKMRAMATDDDRDAYGQSAGQIGNDTGDTYWSACAEVYRQLHIALKPGAVAALVVKDYCKAGKIVPLCDQTCELLTAIGFDVFERTRCWLVKREEHPSLFDDGPVVKTTSRKSFFRRLHEKKRPDLAIDFEQVIWARRSRKT